MPIASIALSGCTDTTIDIGDEFTFLTLQNTQANLSDYRGKIVVLDLWATWCQPCQYQMLELRKTYENYTRDEVEILSINTDPDEGIQLIQSFLDQFEQYGYDLNWVFGNEIDNLNKYNPAGSIPRICLFDKEGNLSWQHTGIIFYKDFPDGWTGERITLKEKIDELLDT